MNKNYFVSSAVVFGLITIILFFGGLLGIIFTAIHFHKILEIKESGITENAIITRIVCRARTPDDDIYFTTINDNKTYRFHLVKLTYGEINVRDKIEVKFNDERTLFFVTNLKSATYVSYIVQIFLFLVCLVFSIPFFRGTIELYKSRNVN